MLETNPRSHKSPTEFHYWRNIDAPRWRAVRSVCRALLGFDLAPSETTVQAWASMYFDGDPLAEAFVAEVYDSFGAKAGREMLDLALRAGVGPDGPPTLRRLLADVQAAPSWLDWAEVERGAEVFRRFGVDAFRFAGAITLEGYAESSVAKPLVLTGGYVGSSTRRRFLETASFWIDVSEPGALRYGEPGFLAALRVRIMHVFVRRKLSKHPEWNESAWGIPISQGDALLTLMGGSFAPGVGLWSLGYQTNGDEIRALMHFWRYIGHLMGVRPRWYPQSLQEAAQLTFATFVKGAHGSGEDGRELCRSYAQAFSPESSPSDERAWLSWLRYKKHLGYLRYFLSGRSYRRNDLPAAGPWMLLPLLSWPVHFAADSARRRSSRFAQWHDRRVRRRRRAWLERELGGDEARFTPASKLAR